MAHTPQPHCAQTPNFFQQCRPRAGQCPSEPRMSRRAEAREGERWRVRFGCAHSARTRSTCRREALVQTKAHHSCLRGQGVQLANATSEDERCARARFRRDEARAGRFESRPGEARAERRRTDGGTGSVSLSGGGAARRRNRLKPPRAAGRARGHGTRLAHAGSGRCEWRS
jgi:hypothetical protein